MKRLLLLSVCIVLAGALTAQADGVFGTFTFGTESATVNYTRTAQTGTYAALDMITLKIGTLNNMGPDLINGLGNPGTSNPIFSGHTSSDYFYVRDFDDVGDPGVLVNTGAAKPGSFVNFGSNLGSLVLTPKSGQPSYASVDGGQAHAYSSMVYGWITSDPSKFLGVAGTLARFYVPTGKDLDYVGGLITTNGSGIILSGSGSTAIPEPGTLALLASGLIGLMAYAWRKRK